MRYSGDISDSFSRSLYQISGIEHKKKKKKKNGCTKDILKCISLYSNFMLTILIKILYKCIICLKMRVLIRQWSQTFKPQ